MSQRQCAIIHSTTDRKIMLGFALAFGLLMLVPLVVQRNRARLAFNSERVARTYEVIATLENAIRCLVQAESFKRSVVSAGQQRDLAQYQASMAEARHLITRLTEVTGDNPLQQQRLAALAPLIDSSIATWNGAMQASPKRSFDSALRTSSDGGSMEGVLALLHNMRRDEHRLLAERRAAMDATLTTGMKTFWSTVLLNFLLLGVSFCLVKHYIARRRGAELHLQQAKQAAEQASVAKSNFLANMSHEIRTPMTAILGYAETLLEPDQTPSERLDCLQPIRRNARHLLELINDVLDISKIEAGKMTAEQIVCDLPQLAGEVTSMMRPRAAAKGLTFRLIYEGAIPRQIRTDPLRLKQVLVNLVGNAIKFTEKGQVDLCVSCQVHPPVPGSGESEGGSTVRFDVIDSGIGMSAQQIDRIFQPFSQADNSMSRRFGGSGLGLTISKRLVALLGGDIAVKSTPLVGSVFSVTIAGGAVDEASLLHGLNEAVAPAPAAAATPAAPDNDEPAGSLIRLEARILLVEDGTDNQRLISAYLRKAGAEVAVAENGLLALELMQSQPFDLVLMDMQMPEMDGYTATAELRRRGFALPVVALTAHAMANDRAKCINAGCTDYLSKPISRQNLLRTLQRHLQGEPPAATSPAPSPARPALRSDFADEAEMRDLLTRFVDGLPAQVQQLEQLISGHDIASLRRAVHQIKGSGGGYGFMSITEAAARAEKEIEQSASPQAIAQQVQELIGLLKAIEGYPVEKVEVEMA